MIESPLLRQVLNETRQESILQVLESKFEAVPPAIADRIRAVTDESCLRELTRAAGRCSTLDEFISYLN